MADEEDLLGSIDDLEDGEDGEDEEEGGGSPLMKYLPLVGGGSRCPDYPRLRDGLTLFRFLR